MMAGVLLRNELLKAIKRFAFWVTLCSCTAMVAIQFGTQYYARESGFALPGGWRLILGSSAILPLVFSSVVLILLVSNEFVWRTARQNVIDGLSRGEVFLGKAFLIPLLGIVFLGVHLLTGAGFAYAATGSAARSGALIHASHVWALGGLVLAFVGYLTSALFVGLAIRNPGSAVGFWVLYVILLERLLGLALLRLSDHMKPVLRYFPVSAFNKLTDYFEYDPEAWRMAAERAAQMGRPAPDVWGLGV